MPLPNLSALRQRPTGHLQNAEEWLDEQGGNPNRDPITTEDWRAGVREQEEDGPPPENGWILVVDKDGVPTPEPQYLYDVEALAQHLLNGGVSPLSRLPPNRKDKQACINKANKIREKKHLPKLQRMTPGAPPAGDELPPLPAPSRAHGRNVPEAEANATTFREVREMVQARRAEERRQQARSVAGQAPAWRRRIRERWGGGAHPILTAENRDRYEGWLRALPPSAVEAFLRDASPIFQRPQIVDDVEFTLGLMDLRGLLDALIQQAETAPAGPARAAPWAAEAWEATMDDFRSFAQGAEIPFVEDDQDAMTAWVNSVWQMLEAWRARMMPREREDIPQAPATQLLPSFPAEAQQHDDPAMGGQAWGAIPMPGHRPGDREAREARLQELEQQLQRLQRDAQEREPQGGPWLHRG